MIYNESNDNKLTRYSIKLGFMFFASIILYIVVSFAEGTFKTADWDNVGATVYLLMTCQLITIVLLDRK